VLAQRYGRGLLRKTAVYKGLVQFDWMGVFQLFMKKGCGPREIKGFFMKKWIGDMEFVSWFFCF